MRIRSDQWLWIGYFLSLILIFLALALMFVLTGCGGCEDTCARYVQVDCHVERQRTDIMVPYCDDYPGSTEPCFEDVRVCTNVCVERRSPRLR
jgi:hypothetical protein